MDPDKKDFLLHLYDKLWENMDSKEGRLWNYLAIYGAAIALTFGAGKFTGMELHAVILVLVLTIWAVLIVLNANWWYYRNLLLVTRIEDQFPGAVTGVVPRQYRENPQFRFDKLYAGSILMLLLVALLFWSKSVLQLWSPGSINSMATLTSLCALYCLYMFGLLYCISLHEFYIHRYYDAKKDLWNEAKSANKLKKPDEVKEAVQPFTEAPGKKDEITTFADEELRTRRANNWRWRGMVLLILATVLIDGAFLANDQAKHGFLFLAFTLHILVVVLYLVLGIKYSSHPASHLPITDFHFSLFEGGPEESKSTRFGTKMTRVIAASLGLSVCLLFYAALLGMKSAPPSASVINQQVEALEEQLHELNSDLGSMQRNNVELQGSLLDKKLAEYVKRKEALQQYVTMDEASKTFVTRREFETCQQKKVVRPR